MNLNPRPPRLAAAALAATLTAGLFALGAAGAGRAQAACLTYEPATVTLSGRLARPLREDEARRAAASTASTPGAPLWLRLDRPVCIQPGSGAPGETEVSVVELVFLRGPGLAPALAGRRVAVSGALFHSDRRGGAPRIGLTVAGLGRAR